MMLNTKGRYAVMALVDLVKQGKDSPVTLAGISTRQEIALSYLEQIFSRLRRRGIVRAVKGPGGGYLLAKTPENIPVSDIIQAVEEPIKMTRCAHAAGGCMGDKTRCITHDLWEGLEIQIQNYLRAVSLADVCERKLASAAQRQALAAHPLLAVTGDAQCRV